MTAPKIIWKTIDGKTYDFENPRVGKIIQSKWPEYTTRLTKQPARLGQISKRKLASLKEEIFKVATTYVLNYKGSSVADKEMARYFEEYCYITVAMSSADQPKETLILGKLLNTRITNLSNVENGSGDKLEGSIHAEFIGGKWYGKAILLNDKGFQVLKTSDYAKILLDSLKGIPLPEMKRIEFNVAKDGNVETPVIIYDELGEEDTQEL